MKFTCRAKDLRNALSRILDGGIKRTSATPILTTALFKAASGGMRISATDLDVAVQVTIPCDSQEDFEACLPMQFLADWSDLAGDVETAISINDEGIASISAANAKTAQPSMPAADYPQLPELSEAQYVALDASLLIEMLGLCMFSASDSAVAETGVRRTGVYISASDGILSVSVVDAGHRVAIVKRPVDASVDFAATVPIRATTAMRKLFSGAGEIVLHVTDTVLRVESTTITFMTGLIADSGPNFKKVESISAPNRIRFARQEALAAFKRVGLASRDRCSLSVEQNTMSIDAESDIQIAVDEIEVESDSDCPRLLFATSYLINALSALPDSVLEMWWSGPRAPVIFRRPEDSGFLHMVAQLAQ